VVEWVEPEYEPDGELTDDCTDVPVLTIDSNIENVLLKVGIPDRASIFQMGLHCGQIDYQK